VPFAAGAVPSSGGFFSRGGFVLGGGGASGISIFSVGFTRAEIFLLAGADSSFVFITENPCVLAQAFWWPTGGIYVGN